MLTGDMLTRAALEVNLEAKLIFIIDTADPLRKVYHFLSPEYEDCRRLAREKKIPIWRIYHEALFAAKEALNRGN